MIKRYLLTTAFCLTIPFFMASSVHAEIAVSETNTGTVEADVKGAAKDEEKSEYENLAFSIANNYVNIRKQPSLDSEIIGKLYEGSAATVISEKDEWVKVESGSVTGYIKKEYLAIGDDAEKLLDKYAVKIATVTTETLKVREKSTTDSICLTLIPEGETYTVSTEKTNWAKINVNSNKGYVSKDYVDISYKFDYAVSIAEELARIEAENAAEESTSLQVQSSYSSSNSSSTNSSETVSTSSDSSVQSFSEGNTGSKIANYAAQFVGNPYVWGGTSLTNGTDCSGFTQSIFRTFGYSIPRTSRAQATVGTSISADNLQAGDLIFYADGGTVSHVALYIGGGRVVHASNAKDGIKISQYNYRSIYTIRRIL